MWPTAAFAYSFTMPTVLHSVLLTVTYLQPVVDQLRGLVVLEI